MLNRNKNSQYEVTKDTSRLGFWHQKYHCEGAVQSNIIYKHSPLIFWWLLMFCLPGDTIYVVCSCRLESTKFLEADVLIVTWPILENLSADSIRREHLPDSNRFLHEPRKSKLAFDTCHRVSILPKIRWASVYIASPNKVAFHTQLVREAEDTFLWETQSDQANLAKLHASIWPELGREDRINVTEQDPFLFLFFAAKGV